MLLRLGPAALVLYLLLACFPVEAQLQIQPLRDAAPCDPAEEPSLQAEVVLWLFVVQEGRMQRLDFTAEELTKMSGLTVDGYINGAVVLSTASLSVSVGQTPMDTIGVSGDGSLGIKHFGQLLPDSFWTTSLPAGTGNISKQQLQGRYALFSKVPGDALSTDSVFAITFEQGDRRHALNIRQHAPLKLKTCNLPDVKSGTSDFYFLGNDFSLFQQTSTDFKERVSAIQEGIQAVEAIVADSIVERVHIIEYDGSRNAYTCKDEADIWLYSDLFWNETLPELRTIAEHEAMHILSDRLKLSGNPRMRELFTQLIPAGHPISSQPLANQTGRVSHLTDFINEFNFLRGMSGGHSQDNIDEFCASFLHTLLYIDRLEPLLDQPVITQNRTLRMLSASDQMQLLRDYRRVLETIIDEAPERLPVSLATLFQSCLEKSRQLSHSIEAQLTNTMRNSLESS